MNRKTFQSRVDDLPVFDTHSHLKGMALPARDFWDIGHYFWLIRELQAAGYPEDPEALTPARRADAFWAAYQATVNTSMNWVARRILGDLYGIELTSAKDVREADRAVRGSTRDTDWPAKVCRRTNIRRIFTNAPADAPFEALPGVAGVIPRLERFIREWMNRVGEAGDQAAALRAVEGEIEAKLAGFRQAGYRGVMTSDDPWGRLHERTHDAPPLRRDGNTQDAIAVAVLHALCESASRHDLTVQFFLGVEKGWGSVAGGGGVPAYQGDRILNLHGLFKKYPGRFDLVIGDGLGNTDAVNAARIFPNVHLGGLWWYNFRDSIYRQIMQQRFEALPFTSSAIVVSDARCIEWCYGKIVLIKRILADFLFDKVNDGWIDADGALLVARNWLHDSADALYGDRS